MKLVLRAIYLPLLLPVALLHEATFSQAQTYSTNVGGGTLSWQASYNSNYSSCPVGSPGGQRQSIGAWTFSSFAYATGSGTQTFSGQSAAYLSSPGGSYCPPTGPQPATLNLSGQSYNIAFSPQSGGYGSAAITYTASGSIDPKFVVLAVTYAPPGSKSSVNYGSSTLLGTSSSINNTFTAQTSSSISIGGGFHIFGTGGMTTGTASSSFSQQQDSSQSVSINKTSSNSNVVPGPQNSGLGVDHDYDIVWVWLNPKVALTTPSSNNVIWNGYSFDQSDPVNDIDYVGLYVSWLKNPSTIPSDVAAKLARSWSSQGGLNASDYTTLLARDPFSNANYNPATDSSGRFDMLSGQTFPYEPPPAGGQPYTHTYSLQYANTSQSGQASTDTYQVGFSVDAQSTGAFGAMLTVDLKNSTSTTWVNKWSATRTNTTGQTSTLSVTGPTYTDGYNGPIQMQVWVDNVYGTFMFQPI